jgi:hypothetical protein
MVDDGFEFFPHTGDRTMDKKVLNAIVEGMVEQVKTNNGVTETEARAMVGMTLRKLSARVVEVCKAPEVAV